MPKIGALGLLRLEILVVRARGQCCHSDRIDLHDAMKAGILFMRFDQCIVKVRAKALGTQVRVFNVQV